MVITNNNGYTQCLCSHVRRRTKIVNSISRRCRSSYSCIDSFHFWWNIDVLNVARYEFIFLLVWTVSIFIVYSSEMPIFIPFFHPPSTVIQFRQSQCKHSRKLIIFAEWLFCTISSQIEYAWQHVVDIGRKGRLVKGNY